MQRLQFQVLLGGRGRVANTEAIERRLYAIF